MDGNEQVCFRCPGFLGTVAKWNEEIGIPGHQDTHVWLGLYNPFQPSGNGQDHIFFLGAVIAKGTGILTTVAWVNGNRDPAVQADRS